MTLSFHRRWAVLMCAVVLSTSAAAQTETAEGVGTLLLSLNSTEARENGCRFTFVTRNRVGTEIEDIGVEIAIFRTGGGLDRLMRLSLGRLLDGRTRVSQFDIRALPCEEIESVLINDVTRCKGGDLTALVCLKALHVTSRTEAELGL